MKRKRLLRVFSFILLCFMTISCIFLSPAEAVESNVTREELYQAAQKTIDYYYNQYKDNEFQGILDWPALGLFGLGEDVSGAKWTVNGKNGAYWREEEVRQGIKLSKIKNTDFQRTIIGICAAGKDPRNFGGIDLVEILKNTMLPNGHFADSVADRKTGKPVGNDLINAHCFGVIAMHCAGEPIPNRDKCLEWLIDKQLPDGGFTWDVKSFSDPEDYQKVESEVDMTAAALMTFAILGLDENHPVVIDALDFLKKKQSDDGGFYSWGNENPESCSWVIQALTMLGQDPMGEAWTKPSGGNPVSAMLKFQLEDGSFTHVFDENDDLPIYENGMSTEQALYGMADAYNKIGVYDLLNNKYRSEAEKNLFSDFKPGQFGFSATMDLVYDYVLNGYADGTFKSEKPVTRAEFAKFLVYGLKLTDELMEGEEENIFTDVSSNHWAKGCIYVCADKGYVRGTTNSSFAPSKNITGEELMTMLVRGAGLEEEAKKLQKDDKDWSYGYLKIAEEKGFLYEAFEAKKPASRAQCAWSLVKLRESLD